MKSFLKALLPALALGLMSGSIIQAEDEAGPPPPSDQPPPPPGGRRGQRGGGRGMMDPAQRLQQLDAAVKLTDDQKTKITAIFKKNQDDMQALRGGGTPRDQMMGKMQDLQKATHDQIRALLTEDQQKKFDAMPTPPPPGRGGAGGGRRRGGAGAPPPPPPADDGKAAP